MRPRGFLVAIGIAAFLLPVAATAARANQADEQTYVTFSAPVEIPGRVLPAGTYQFKLLDTMDAHNVVEVSSKDGSTVYATLLTIPDERATPTNEPVVTFEERAPGAPEAVRSFFYPGNLFGQQFMYPN